jgi:hypothetical protein
MSVQIDRETAADMLGERTKDVCDTFVVVGFIAGTDEAVAVSKAMTEQQACALNNLLEALIDQGGVAVKTDADEG